GNIFVETGQQCALLWLKYFGQVLRKFANLVLKDGCILKIGFMASKKLEHE
ncbi:hypothetical protein RYX36_005637, partial [Vicia faba]